MESFKHDIYIVLDLPEEFAEKVKKIRSEYRYPMSLPAEITVAGSSGIGVLQNEQKPNNVYTTMENIAAHTKPIKGIFGEVSRFPNTDIFFFTLQDENPIRDFQEELIKSNIKFLESPFPFQPHCTICNSPSLTNLETRELLSKKISGEFILDTVSFYSLERKPNNDINVGLLKRLELSGK